MFSFADQNPQCVIAFDDLDVLVPTLSNVSSMFQVRLSSYFLRELRYRNWQANGTVLLGIVGDNQLSCLNAEIRCCGFMDTVIHIPRLDKRRRKAMIDCLLQSKEVDMDVKEWLCEQTASYSAADLSYLCSKLLSPIIDKITIDVCKENLSSNIPSSSRELHTVRPLEGGFASLFGISNIIERVKETIIQPLLHPEAYQLYHLQPPSGAIFYGPSGTGKSAMIEAIAAETRNQIQVIEISCTDILGKVRKNKNCYE